MKSPSVPQFGRWHNQVWSLWRFWEAPRKPLKPPKKEIELQFLKLIWQSTMCTSSPRFGGSIPQWACIKFGSGGGKFLVWGMRDIALDCRNSLNRN